MPKTLVLLLVEDEVLILDFAQAALEDGGYEVVTAMDGQSAIQTINKRIGELSGIITDIRLPAGGPDGWEIARHARELKHEIAVVYTTGDSAIDWAAQGVPKSVVLQKPYAGAQMVTAVSSLLNETDSAIS